MNELGCEVGELKMSKDEYKSLEPFKGLPLFGEDDPRCETIAKVAYDTAYTGEVLEADELALAKKYIAQNELVPKDGIRFDMDDKVRVFGYFWRISRPLMPCASAWPTTMSFKSRASGD